MAHQKGTPKIYTAGKQTHQARTSTAWQATQKRGCHSLGDSGARTLLLIALLIALKEKPVGTATPVSSTKRYLRPPQDKVRQAHSVSTECEGEGSKVCSTIQEKNDTANLHRETQPPLNSSKRKYDGRHAVHPQLNK